jgi:hypothetical protein
VPLRVLDSGDPRSLDLTGFAFGFPAFLVHTLHEGRRQAGERPIDLWPPGLCE